MGDDERGTAMMLVPAGFLILIILAAITVDFSVAFLGAREVSDEANAVANDIAAKAVDIDAFRKDGTVVIDCTKAAELAQEASTRLPPPWLKDATIEVSVCRPDGDTVTVAARGTVDYIFSKGLPGGPRTVGVHATGSATASRGTAATSG